MAQINFTINQDELLEILQTKENDAFKTLFEKTLNAFIQAESEEKLKAKPFERSDERTDSRNGSRPKLLNTRVGTITLTIPRHREEPFHSMLFNNYARSEQALIATMAEMVAAGVSTRKVAKVMETL